jgi:hypothetical protein
MVGRFAVVHREDLEPTREAFEALERALAKLGECEDCALATFTGGSCRVHARP